MRIKIDPDLDKTLKKLKKQNPQLSFRIQKQLKNFATDPHHSSLRTHKLSGKQQNVWSISITKSIRMTYFVEGDTAYFFKVGTHDEVYKK